MRRNRAAVAGASCIALVSLVAIAASPWGDPPRSLLTRLAAHDPYLQDRDVLPPSPPGAGHPLGTDPLGRDLLSRLLHGARVSLLVGLVAEGIALVLGVAVGAAAGYAGGRADALLMRLTDLLLSIPLPLLAMGAMAVVEDPSLPVVFAILGLLGWGEIARLIRGEFRSLRDRPFAEAARAMGAGAPRVAMRHLLPNAVAPALVLATVGVAGNILTEAWLSFLGLGAQPPTPSWGSMIADAQDFITTQPRLAIYPGIALAATVGGFMLLADGLRALLDPRRRGSTWAA